MNVDEWARLPFFRSLADDGELHSLYEQPSHNLGIVHRASASIDHDVLLQG